MELILLCVLIPELLALCLGLFMVVASLNGCGDFARLIPEWRPRRKNVGSGYWGAYAGGPKKGSVTMKLPKIFKEPEYDHGCPDWTG